MQTKCTLYRAISFGSRTAIMPSSYDSGTKQNKVYYVVPHNYIQNMTFSIEGGGRRGGVTL